MVVTGWSGILALLLLVAFPKLARATDYYVDQGSAAASDTNSGSASQPWKTITRANEVLVAGDTVFIKAGTYSSFIEPKSSGSASKPITFKRFGSDAVTISNAAFGIHLNGRSYVVVEGISFQSLDKFLWLENSSNHNTIASCNFDQARTVGWSGSKIYTGSSHNWLHHCRLSKVGKYTTEDTGTVLDIGNENTATDFSNYNLVENNTMFHGGHHVLGVYGMYTVVRNNYFHNEKWLSGFGNRVVYLNGHKESSGRNLIEGNRIAYSGKPPDNYGGAGMSLDTSHNIVRRNLFYHNDVAGLAITTASGYPTSPTSNKVYHNTFFHNAVSTFSGVGAEGKAGIAFANWGGPSAVIQNAVKNNILRLNPKPYGTSGASLASQIFAGNWEEAGDPLFVAASATLGDPTNADLPDLHLQAGSPCKDKGTHLTRITSAPGSGTILKVEDAGYFMDGWGIVEGDEIQLLGTSQRARITKVDYATSTLTVSASLTWTQDQGIALAYEDTAPDQGAYEIGQTQPPVNEAGISPEGGTARWDAAPEAAAAPGDANRPDLAGAPQPSGCSCEVGGAPGAPALVLLVLLLAAQGVRRMGMGMRMSTNTTAISRQRKRRPGESGSSPTGGW